ncbi:polymer-forming cytoskeletal protein [Hyphomonas sp.]|uniref:bactofilin family protein n=1 Tax=Hyphomonas sp. TaxID=87 RepID=UPI003528CD5B
MRGGEPANLILKDTRLEGDLYFPSQLVVSGVIKGNVRCESMLVIERDGRVEGRIEAPVIIVHGELEGTVLATESIEIWSGAKVAGDVAARSVRVDQGSMLTANLLIAADLPDRLGPPEPQSDPKPAPEAAREPVQAVTQPIAPVTPPVGETRPAAPMSPPASFLSPGPARS